MEEIGVKGRKKGATLLDMSEPTRPTACQPTIDPTPAGNSEASAF